MNFKKMYERLVELMDRLDHLPNGKTGNAKRNEYLEEMQSMFHDVVEYVDKQSDNSYLSAPYFQELDDKIGEFYNKYRKPIIR